jgi:hypothetical protein
MTTNPLTGDELHRRSVEALDVSKLSHRIASIVAPIICHFVAALEDRAIGDGVDVLWFMARDGYLPMRVYELVRGAGSPPARYLCVSRRSVSAASSRSYGLREAFLAEWNGENSRLSTLMVPFGLKEFEINEIAAKYGFSSLEENVDFKCDPRFHALCNDSYLQGLIKARSDTAKKALLGYLSSCGFLFPHKAGVVDVGWAGQIQEALQISVSSEKARRPDITGYYMALRDLGGMRRLAGVKSTGLLFDCADPEWKGQSILSCVDTFEDTCRALHGTVVGYDEIGPIFASGTPSRTMELVDEPRLSALHDAILIYARTWSSLRVSLNTPLVETRQTALNACVHLGRFPTAEQSLYFASLGHSLDCGSSINVGSRNEKRIGSLGAIRRAKRARWKEGSVASSFFRLPLQTAICVIRRRRCAGPMPMPKGLKTEQAGTASNHHLPHSQVPHNGVSSAVDVASKGRFYLANRSLDHFVVRISDGLSKMVQKTFRKR